MGFSPSPIIPELGAPKEVDGQQVQNKQGVKLWISPPVQVAPFSPVEEMIVYFHFGTGFEVVREQHHRLGDLAQLVDLKWGEEEVKHS